MPRSRWTGCGDLCEHLLCGRANRPVPSRAQGKPLKNALSDKGSAYGPLGAPYVVAVASSSITTDDYDVKNALYGTEALLVTTGSGGETYPAALARSPDGYWYKGDHWAHRHVSAVLVVKQLHPAFVGTQQHTIWEHPDPERRVPPLPMWRRSTPSAQCISSILRARQRSGSALRTRGRSGSPSRERADPRKVALLPQPMPTCSR